MHASVLTQQAEHLQQDSVLIATNHSDYDYDFIVRNSRMVLDTRNATKHVVHSRERIFRA